VHLTQKETSLLKDLKEQEQVCVEKYNKYAQEAHDGQLKGLFTQIGQIERQHLDTIGQIMGGTVPSMPSGGKQTRLQFTPVYNAATADPNKQKDGYLCMDLLSTEKHVSSVYDTAIFEFRDTNIRATLNHIQKEEQQHGEQIYNYMAQNGMYG
jgi:spore coat protein CotF